MQLRTQYRREKRKLEAEIAAVYRAYAPSLKTKKGLDLEMEEGAMHAEAEWAETALAELETWQIEKEAKQFLITIDPSWYEKDRAGHSVLDKDARARVMRMVRDARRENIKWWVGVIVPILGTLTGLIGTIIGCLAFLKKR